MKVKRYVGETAQEALQKVKSDLGRDAIILNTRKIRKKGLSGFFSKPLVEVVATIDNDVNTVRKHPTEAKAVPKQDREEITQEDINNFKTELANIQMSKNNNTHNKIYNQNGMYIRNEVQAEEEPIKQEKKNIYTPNDNIKSTINKVESNKINLEDVKGISEIKDMLNKVYDAVKVDYENNRLSDVSRKYLKILEDNEVDKAILNDIKEDIIELLSIEKQENENIVRNTLYDILDKYIKDPEPFIPSKNKKVILFIGPTGVGKTTTLAKLAANMVINEKRKVGLITSDTYRIAAVEQLKTYSEIIGVPITIIYSPPEIANAINNYKDKDTILVDTAGRSHKDQYQLMELKSLLKYSIDFEVYLLISATTKFSDCIEIIKNYSFLDNYKLLFTKLDETSTLGVLLNVAYITKKPISYITTGQSVPDDIEIADKGKIINCLLGDKPYERSS